jgi:hypothetical protein
MNFKSKKNTWYNGIKLNFINQIESFDTNIIYFNDIKLVLITCFSLLFQSIYLSYYSKLENNKNNFLLWKPSRLWLLQLILYFQTM